MEARRWKVGELARATGLTVRALHHFDEIGLLRPAERDGSGHRRYTPSDVRRLYRVLALRHLGMPLGEIARSLDGEAGDLAVAVRGQLDEVDRRLAAQRRLRNRPRSRSTANTAPMSPIPRCRSWRGDGTR
jgi:DNA-binding transcriptional MerR regulator